MFTSLNAPVGENKRETKVPGTFVSLFERRDIDESWKILKK
jgi:hypothetical protein